MKRVTVLLLVLLLIPGLIAVPAFATTSGVIDAIEDQNTLLFGDFDWVDGNIGALGTIVDLLDTIGDTIFDGLDKVNSSVTKVNNNVVKILNEIYTQGTLTIGECVKGIRSYIVSIAGYLETGYEETIGHCIYWIYTYTGQIREYVSWIPNKLSSIMDKLDTLISGNVDNAGGNAGESLLQNDTLDSMGDILETSPTIDQDSFDDSISGINGKFQNITSDADGTVLFGALGQIAGGNVFSQLIPTSAMLGILSFALFGRVF